VHLVEDDELNIPDKVSTLVKHAAKDLRRHDQTVGFRVDLHVSGQDADRRSGERLLEVPELLVRECFDWRCIYCPSSVSLVQWVC
jgi:hypothetical protein